MLNKYHQCWDTVVINSLAASGRECNLSSFRCGQTLRAISLSHRLVTSAWITTVGKAVYEPRRVLFSGNSQQNDMPTNTFKGIFSKYHMISLFFFFFLQGIKNGILLGTANNVHNAFLICLSILKGKGNMHCFVKLF